MYPTSTKYCRYIRTEVYSAISLGFPDTPDYPEVVSIVDEISVISESKQSQGSVISCSLFNVC